MIKSIFEDGYWWVEIPDDLWETVEVTDYRNGYPIYVKRQ
jgi:hypothetical protein